MFLLLLLLSLLLFFFGGGWGGEVTLHSKGHASKATSPAAYKISDNDNDNGK